MNPSTSGRLRSYYILLLWDFVSLCWRNFQVKNIIFRKDKIVELCKNKSVLHLGFIQHSHLYEKLIKERRWLHQKISTVAKTLVGFDYLAKEIETIKTKYGYECYFADVMKLYEVNLNKHFDVIVCGELIEHIENPGLMLDGIKRFMNYKTILIITTPNPWSKKRIHLIKSGHLEAEWINKEHVAWYSYETLKQLLERKGYKEIRYDYYYWDTYERFLSYKTKGLLGKLRLIVRKIILYTTKKQNYPGLFFVAALKNGDM